MKFKIFDYAGREVIVDAGDKEIRQIRVEEVTGDEVIEIEYVDGSIEEFDSEDTPCGYEEPFIPKRWEIVYTTMGDVIMGDNKYGLLMKNGKPTLGPNKGYWTVPFWEEAKKKFNIVE